MSKDKKSTQSGVAIISDSPVTMIDTINAKLDKFKHITGSNFKASTMLDNISVQSETDPLVLVKALSSVNARERDFDEAAKELSKEGIINTLPIFKLSGSTPDEWRHDIKLRLQIINQKETIDKLTTLKQRYEAIMEKSHVKEMLDKEAAKILGSL